MDVVLAGDVCYDRAMTERVLPFLGQAWLRGATVLLGDPGRAYLPREGLLAAAAYDVPDSDGPSPPDDGVAAALTDRGDDRHVRNIAPGLSRHGNGGYVGWVRSAAPEHGEWLRRTPPSRRPSGERRAGDPPQYWGESSARARMSAGR